MSPTTATATATFAFGAAISAVVTYVLVEAVVPFLALTPLVREADPFLFSDGHQGCPADGTRPLRLRLVLALTLKVTANRV